MMRKIDIDNVNNADLMRVGRQGDVKKSADAKDPAVESKNAVSEDKLNISERASEVGKLVDQIKELPDVREEKVKSLRDQVEAGTYKPSSESIADAILKDEKI